LDYIRSDPDIWCPDPKSDPAGFAANYPDPIRWEKTHPAHPYQPFLWGLHPFSMIKFYCPLLYFIMGLFLFYTKTVQPVDSTVESNVKSGIKQPLIIALGLRRDINQVFLVVEGHAF
jgi:hypothetical protein